MSVEPGEPGELSADGPAAERTEESATEQRAEEIAHATLRGVIGAMAMSGLRNVTVGLGMVDQSPPEAIMRRRTRGLIRFVPRKRRRAAVELVHWVYGAVGGAGFGVLPAGLRHQPWAGPAYGLVSWAGFELAVAPALGLGHAKNPAVAERIALAVDHLLYGLVLGEIRRRPQE